MRIPEEQIKRDFAKHQADILADQELPDQTRMVVLKWAAPETGVGHMRFVLYSNYLMVTGDYGSAIYAWSSPINLNFLSTCSFDYFLGKCMASENGRDFEEWDSAAAEKWVKGDLKDMAKENECMKLYKEEKEGFLGATESAHDWREFLERLGDETQRQLLGSEWYEYLHVGMVPSIRAELHWQGIKNAALSVLR